MTKCFGYIHNINNLNSKDQDPVKGHKFQEESFKM